MSMLRSKKGFTLVEIVVVLVIIAILAAVSLPALTGYIDDAKNKTAVSEGRTAMVAAQSIASELFGLGVDGKNIVLYLTAGTRGVEANGKVVPDSFTSTIKSLTGMRTGTANAVDGSPDPYLTTVTFTNNTIATFTYGASNSKEVTYSGTEMSAK